MRKNLLIIGGLVAALAVTVLSAHFATPTELDEHVRALHRHIVADDWPQASASLRQLADEWAARRPWLQLTKSVQTVDEIDRLLARLEASVELQDRPTAAESIAEVRRLWFDLRE